MLPEDGVGLVTDGLIWVIDNADVVISAVKGIAVGFIALKAGQAIGSTITAIQGIGTAAKGATTLMGGTKWNNGR